DADRHDDGFGTAPGLQLGEGANADRQLRGEVLDRALHDTGGLGIARREQRIELLPADILAGLVAEWVVAGLAQWFAPPLEDHPERALMARSPSRPSSSFNSTL